MTALTLRQRVDILSSIFDAIPDELRDEHTAQEDRHVQVCSDVLVRLNTPDYDHQRATVTVKFYGYIYGRGKTWPVRKNGTVNVEGILSYIAPVVKDSLARLERLKNGQQLSEEAAPRIERALNSDERFGALGLVADADPVSGSEEGRVLLWLNEKDEAASDHGRRRPVEWKHCTYYAGGHAPGFSIEAKFSGLTEDQFLRVLQLMRELG